MAEFHNMSAPLVGDDDPLFALDLRGTVDEPDLFDTGAPLTVALGPLEAALGPFEAAIGLERAMAALQAELDEASRLDALFGEPAEPIAEPEEPPPPRPDPGAILWPKLVQDLHDTLLRKDAEIAALREGRDDALGIVRRLEAKIACLQHRIDSEAAIRRYREAGLTAA